MKRLITLTLIITAVCFTSCKEKPKDEENGKDSTVVVPTVKKYVIGSYYNVNGVQGIVYQLKPGDTTGMIVSLDERLCAWVDTNISTRYENTGAIDSDDGTVNMKIIEGKGLVNYPAFDWCNKKNTGNIKSWYLPALSELLNIADVCGQLQDSLTANKGTKLEGEYWSSTDCGNAGNTSVNAYRVQISDKGIANKTKSTVLKVRAVRVF